MKTEVELAEEKRWEEFKLNFEKGFVRLNDLDLLFCERLNLQVFLIEQLSQLCTAILGVCDEHIKPIKENLKSEIIELVITHSSSFHDEELVKEVKESIEREQLIQDVMEHRKESKK